MRRTYILDTNVLLADPKSLFVFEEHDVIIPSWVLEEIDKFKVGHDDRAFNARTTSRYLDKLRERGSLKDGVKLKGGGTLRVEWEGLDEISPSSVDNAILRLARRLTDTDPNVVLVSRDTNMRVKGDALGLTVESYRHDHVVNPDKEYFGVREIDVWEGDIEAFYRGDDITDAFGDTILNPHEFVILKGGEGSQKSAIARWDGRQLRKVPRHEAWGISARNKEQLFALDLLLDPNIPLVTISGSAGSGKTLIAMAAALALAEKGTYRRVMVTRPVVPMGRDIGYLPGSAEEKLQPWMQPIFDNLEVIIPNQPNGQKRSAEPSYKYLLDTGALVVEAMTYMRGRSLPNQFILVDEAQNMNSHEARTLLTRVGEGAKIVLTGDPNQIDNPFVDARSNGLSFIVDRFKDSQLAGHVTLRKSERSALAEEANARLTDAVRTK